jgi:hypothetical protein
MDSAHIGTVETTKLNDDGDPVSCEPYIELDGKFTAAELGEIIALLVERRGKWRGVGIEGCCGSF